MMRANIILALTVVLSWSCPGWAEGEKEKHSSSVAWDLYSGSLPPGAVARLGAVRAGHDKGALCVAFFPDGKLLVSGGEDGLVRLWEAASGQLVRTLARQEGRIEAVAVSPDGKSLAVGGDEEIRLIEVASGAVLRRIPGDPPPLPYDLYTSFDRVRTLRFSPDGTLLASTHGGSVLHVWDVPTANLRFQSRRHKADLTSACFSLDGKNMAASSEDGTVSLWDIQTNKTLLLRGHDGVVVDLAFSPDGSVLWSAGWDRTLRQWETASGKELRCIRGHEDRLTCLAVSPDGMLVASGGGTADPVIRIWDTGSGKALHRLEGHGSDVCDVAFSPDGKILASAGLDGTIRRWDPLKGTEIFDTEGHTGAAWCIACSPDGKFLASGGTDGTLRLWEVATRKRARLVPVEGKAGPSLCFFPDGERIACLTGEEHQDVCVWEIQSGKIRRVGRVDEFSPGLSLSVSPDGNALAASSMSGVGIWEVSSGKELLRFKGHKDGRLSGGPCTVRFSPDGKTLASGGCCDGKVRIWDAVSGAEIRAYDIPHADSHVRFSPDGKRLTSGGMISRSGEDTLCVWETATGKVLFKTPAGHIVTSVAFSPDARVLASATTENVALWDLATEKNILELKGHAGWVLDVAFFPDGRTLATSGMDGSILLWDLKQMGCPQCR